MKVTTLFSSLAVLFTLFIMLAGNAAAQSPKTLIPALCGSVSHETSVTYDDQDINLGTCERGCRIRFGYEPTMSDPEPGLLVGGPYYAYAQCIADCNRNFWNEFDRKAREIPTER